MQEHVVDGRVFRFWFSWGLRDDVAGGIGSRRNFGPAGAIGSPDAAIAAHGPWRGDSARCP